MTEGAKTPPPRVITAAWLRRHGATCDQVAKVHAEWPEGGALTRANLRRAAELHLDLDWFAAWVLTASAWAEYARVTAPIRAEYARVTSSALADALGLA